MKHDIEKLSEYVHDLWCKWSVKLLQEERLSPKRIRRWSKCHKPYGELSERMKNVDRKIAREILKVLKKGGSKC